MGLKGNLTAGEIIEQLVHALAVVPVRNIVFMVSRRKTLSLLCSFTETAACLRTDVLFRYLGLPWISSPGSNRGRGTIGGHPPAGSPAPGACQHQI